MNIIETLKRDEGFEPKPYLDTQKKLTIGYGTNLDIGISEIEAELLLINRVGRAREKCEKCLGWFPIIDSVRQDVVVMMVYCMGFDKFIKFKNAIDAIQRGDFRLASQEMLNSLWARQVKDRAIRLARMMSTGQYPHV